MLTKKTTRIYTDGKSFAECRVLPRAIRNLHTPFPKQSVLCKRQLWHVDSLRLIEQSLNKAKLVQIQSIAILGVGGGLRLSCVMMDQTQKRRILSDYFR
jgi:hypothetical protein